MSSADEVRPADDTMAHRWAIDEAEYRRHEQRRGRRHAFEHLDPRRTALVAIDLVPFFVDESPFVRGVLGPIDATARAVRAGGGTVAWVVPATTEPSALDIEFYGPEVAAAYGRSGGTGPPASRLDHRVGAEPEADLFVEKLGPSAFFPGHCHLDADLRDRGIDTVLLAGTVANVCCEASARDARATGYRVILLADAIAAPSDDVLNATLRTIYRSFGDVRTTGDVVDLLAQPS